MRQPCEIWESAEFHHRRARNEQECGSAPKAQRRTPCRNIKVRIVRLNDRHPKGAGSVFEELD